MAEIHTGTPSRKTIIAAGRSGSGMACGRYDKNTGQHNSQDQKFSIKF
jgi:hypothetical protein